ncbi:pyridoxal phosphate-dependent aminotransferase [Candidatus Uabimicrobium sp. HlEnr_7]|uniref:pyridoxal phosphate-dependent aminotransferase n=1 Tax=Candidatus Uabimicrobium helgolandensis TaxID=3095367 RepID=UPI0035568878
MQIAKRVSSPQASIFAQMTALANKYDAVNLGQGFPNMPCANFIKEFAQQAIEKDLNQYAPGNGLPILTERLANLYANQFSHSIDPSKQIMITVGATEAIFATCQAFVEEGDEVILFEPFYDSYPTAVKMAGGSPLYVPLTYENEEWVFSREELEKSFSNNTKLIFINTPHNPCGKIFSTEELQFIARLCCKYDVIAVCDEVYEYMVFDGLKHKRMANIEGMANKTITISSAGKTFGVTGWKVGWIIADNQWIQAISEARQWISFSVATPLQYAIAKSIEKAQNGDFFIKMQQDYQQKRDLLIECLQQKNLYICKPQATYFIMVNHQHYNFTDDVVFCEYLTKEIGVTAIPPSFFYSDAHRHLAKNYARFCFCKDEETLAKAGKKLEKLGKK